MVYEDKRIWSKIMAGVLLFIGTAGLVVLAIIQFAAGIVDLINKPEQYSYPASEYRMSIKTTTMNNQTDTTYVITERSNTH
jgi:hypothetical protein